MFHRRAHSFTQQARLAISLSWIAGYTNALTFLECGQVTSHMTGIASLVGVDVVEGDHAGAIYLLGLLGCFLLGAFASGLLLELGRARHYRALYVLPMSVEALVLGAFAVLGELTATGSLTLAHQQAWLTFLPAFAMGVQNATITRISGGVVRTTHVTGVVTDLGLECSRLLLHARDSGHVETRHRRQEGLRALLLASIVGSFVFGGAIGATCYRFIEPWSMLPAVAFLCALVGRDLVKPIAPIGLRFGDYRGTPIIAVYHAEPPANARPGYMPDLQSWADRLDEHVRVVVLDIAALPVLDDSAAHEVHMLMVYLRGSGRSLVVAGMREQHLEQLRHCGLLQNFDEDELCDDLATAIDLAEDIAEEL